MSAVVTAPEERGTDPPGRASRAFAELLTRAAEALHEARGVASTCVAIGQSARATIPGIDHAGLCVIADGRVETYGATDDIVRSLGDIQQATGEGPCVDSAASESVLELSAVAHDQRWPRYIPLAVETGVLSQIAVRLEASRKRSSTLLLGSTTSEMLDPDAAWLTGLYAVHASCALDAARREEQLEEAMETRRTIGAAMGIVMERYGLDSRRAFKLLLRRSQDRNVKLRHVAEEVVRIVEHRARQGG